MYQRPSVEQRRAQIRRRPGTLLYLIKRAGFEIEFPCSACGDPEYDPAAPLCERCGGTGCLLVPRDGTGALAKVGAP